MSTLLEDKSTSFLISGKKYGKNKVNASSMLGFPCGSAGKESTCNVGGPGFDPWVGKIPWRRERLPTPVFWPGGFHGPYSP